jgi:1-aminocyclopropane-1-carboxylate deaminase
VTRLAEFARTPLLFGPSPVHPLPRLSAHLGGTVDIWAKREDVNSGLAYGGNKTRKLEYLVAEALAQGGRYARVDRGRAVEPHATGRRSRGAPRSQGCPGAGALGRLARRRLRQGRQHPAVAHLGADVRLDPAGFDIGIRRSWEEALESVRSSGGRTYAIPAGASDHRLGGLGFANWAREVEAQERDLGLFFDTSATVAQTHAQIARIARATADLIDLGRDLRDDEITLLGGWHAGVYGIPDAKTVDAIRLCARLEGMLTDPVYEGKSMAALIDLVRDGRIPAGSKVLYAHLGGQPALNAYSGAF